MASITHTPAHRARFPMEHPDCPQSGSEPMTGFLVSPRLPPYCTGYHFFTRALLTGPSLKDLYGLGRPAAGAAAEAASLTLAGYIIAGEAAAEEDFGDASTALGTSPLSFSEESMVGPGR